MSADDHTDIVDALGKQAEDLCDIHDHITRIISNLEIDDDWFNGYDDPARANADLKPVVKIFLYMYACELNESELARRLNGATYMRIRFDLPRALNQAYINYNKRHRFTLSERQLLKDAAERIRDVCGEHDVLRNVESDPDPSDLQDDGLSERLIRENVKKATEIGFDGFSADRADNAKYALEAYFERQGYLNMSRAGATTKKRRFERLSNRGEVPHGSSHNRTLKKIGDPDRQLTLDHFTEGKTPPFWKLIRDDTLDAFHTGVENIIEELTDPDRDNNGFREPVHAAIDITTFNFYPSPFVSRYEAGEDDYYVEYEDDNGNTKQKYIRGDYPEMVSGLKNSNERGYKFATISIIAEDTPVVLGIEPVRDNRRWEPGSPETTSRGEIVARLLDQAEQHVDIHKVFLDREFDAKEVRHTIDDHESLYVIGKTTPKEVDLEKIEEIKEHDVYDSKLRPSYHEYNGEHHPITYVYKPTDEDGESYTIFTMNEHVDHHRAEALIGQYGQRMEIENHYKTIKENFLPATATKDYRVRFLYFVIGALLYNVWRLANFILRDEVAVDLGESPPVPAGELIELVGMFLFDPGG